MKELSYLPRLMNQFKFSFFGQYVAYYVAGWYFVHVGIPSRGKRYGWYCAGVLSLVITILFVQISGDYSNGYSNLNLLIFLYASSVFLMSNSIPWHMNGRGRIAVVLFSKLSFGIYIIHPLVLEMVRRVMPYQTLPARYIVGSYAVVVAVSWVLTFILSKLPVLKYTVRM